MKIHIPWRDIPDDIQTLMNKAGFHARAMTADVLKQIDRVAN